MHVYQQHLERIWAILLGFGTPLAGEVFLAIATSAYSKARGRERYRNVSQTIETAVADRLESAIEAMDVATIQQHVERTINRLARQAVDSVAAQALSYYRIEPAQQEEEVNTDQPPAAFGPQNLLKAQAARAEQRNEQAEDRNEAILRYLAEHGAQGTSAIADAVGIHRDTARKGCKELAATGYLETINRRWQLTLFARQHASKEATQ